MRCHGMNDFFICDANTNNFLVSGIFGDILVLLVWLKESTALLTHLIIHPASYTSWFLALPAPWGPVSGGLQVIVGAPSVVPEGLLPRRCGFAGGSVWWNSPSFFSKGLSNKEVCFQPRLHTSLANVNDNWSFLPN